MKRIIDFKSYKDTHHSIHCIDLEDVPLFAIFSEPDGGVVINKGLTIKRGRSINGKDVKELSISSFNGAYQVLLHYNKEGVPLTHVLGEIEKNKLDVAKDWIHKINQICTLTFESRRQ
jgi:hypothetical protein